MTAGLALAARKAAISWALPLLLLVAWEMASRAGLMSPRLLPAPSAVASAKAPATMVE